MKFMGYNYGMEKKINERKSLLREAEKVERQRRPRRQHSVFSGILTKIIIILILIMLLLSGSFWGYYTLSKKLTPKTETNISIVTTQLSLCQELVTAKYHYSDIIALNKKIAFSKSLSLVKYSGVIRIGIPDIVNCDYEIFNDGKSIKIKIPDVEILGNDITGQEVFDENLSIFVPITTDEVFSKIQESKDKTLEELINGGILNEARENARKVIQQIFMSAGFQEVIVV